MLGFTTEDKKVLSAELKVKLGVKSEELKIKTPNSSLLIAFLYEAAYN